MLLMTMALLLPACSQPQSTGESIAPYTDVRSKNLQTHSFLSRPEVIWTLTFDTKTLWPERRKLPAGFDPVKLLEWGKNPGLSVGRVHQDGITGGGVAVAVIDQALKADHAELADIDLVYLQNEPGSDAGERTSMHGPGVTSLLAGAHTGVAPGVTLYYWPISSGTSDQTQFAEGVRAVIRQNQQLPADQRIRAISVSTAPNLTSQGGSEFAASIGEAESAGILVVTVEHPFKLMPIACKPYADKDDPASWERAGWVQGYSPAGRLLVPTSGLTVATGVPESPDAYIYAANGGLSWAVPYVVGTLALGWQVNPSLPNDLAVKYLVESGTDYMGGKIINPYGYVEMVSSNR